jgi:hypothetical protein
VVFTPRDAGAAGSTTVVPIRVAVASEADDVVLPQLPANAHSSASEGRSETNRILRSILQSWRVFVSRQWGKFPRRVSPHRGAQRTRSRRAPDHSAYIASISRAYFSFTTLRFTFRVGVSSPPSMDSGFFSTTNFFTCSTRASSTFTASSAL